MKMSNIALLLLNNVLYYSNDRGPLCKRILYICFIMRCGLGLPAITARRLLTYLWSSACRLVKSSLFRCSTLNVPGVVVARIKPISLAAKPLNRRWIYRAAALSCAGRWLQQISCPA